VQNTGENDERPVLGTARMMNLRLLQISDSALPVGGYTHSWGLEAAVAAGLVTAAESLEHWTRCWLRYQLGPGEGVVAAYCCRCAHAGDGAGLRSANEVVRTSLNPPSLREASLQTGGALRALAATWGWSAAGVADLLAEGEAGWHHAVVFGVLAALAGAEPVDALAAYLHQSAAGMIASALRALPVGHTHGQQVLAYLHGDIESLACELAVRGLERAGGGGPSYEIFCDEQTRLYTRLFRS
jgi:urease accessory protein